MNKFVDPPDIAIEIASPDQSVSSQVRKCFWYVANGVWLALVIDPDDESILVFRPGEPTVSWRGSDRVDLGDVVPGLELTASGVFDLLVMK